MKTTPWVLAILVLSGCAHKDASDEKADAKPLVEVSVASVKVGDITATLAVSGSLSPLPNGEAKVAALAPGRIKSLLVKVGDSVQKGQLIATLDPVASLGQVQQAQGTVRVAEATLRQSRSNYTAQTRTQTAAVEQAQLNLEAQQVALTKLKNGSRPQEIAQALAGVRSAQAGLQIAQQALSRAQTLFSEGLLARKDLEAAQAQQQTANAALTTAQQALSLARQGNRPEDIKAGTVAVSQAEQQLKAAQAQRIQIASKAQDVRIAAGQLDVAKGALQAALAQAAALNVYAPIAGTVVGRTLNKGESVDVTTPIANIVNLDSLRLLLNVPSASVHDLVAGQRIEFTADSDTTKARTARITVVNRAVDPATNTVQVEALVDNKVHDLRDDGIVKARIFTSIHRHVLLVPIGSLIEKDGKSTVFVAGSDDVAHAKEVEVGSQDATQAEVKSGLKNGDRIVTTGAYELDDGTKIELIKDDKKKPDNAKDDDTKSETAK